MAITNKPQNIDDASCYYEGKGSIDIIVWPDNAQPPDRMSGSRKGTFNSFSDGLIHIRIPSAMLLKTLKRQGKAK